MEGPFGEQGHDLDIKMQAFGQKVIVGMVKEKCF